MQAKAGASREAGKGCSARRKWRKAGKGTDADLNDPRDQSQDTWSHKFNNERTGSQAIIKSVSTGPHRGKYIIE